MDFCCGIGLCSGFLPEFASANDDTRLRLLKSQIEYARKNSSFYRERLKGTLSIQSLEDLRYLPFTTREDIELSGRKMVCVGASDIQRIVTIRSSGTTGQPKRLYFTAGDLERTRTFFAQGMSWMCSKGDRVGIFMPCSAPEGLGQLLAQALERIGAIPKKIGLITDIESVLSMCQGLNVMVGLPGQMRMLALCAPELRPEVVLLSGDYVPDSARKIIEDTWGCYVFNHFGMTETGLGGAVECPKHDGMLIRRDEMIFEIVDKFGQIVPHGQPGEIVITTLRREAMPLIRYKTGDKGIMHDGGKCCISPQLKYVYGRIRRPYGISMPELEEALYSLKHLLDFKAELWGNKLHITALATSLPLASDILDKVRAITDKEVTASVSLADGSNRTCFYPGKRTIIVRKTHC